MLNLLFTHRVNAPSTHLVKSKNEETLHSLAQARAGQQVTITGFGKISPTYRQHLQAYGLLPGRTILVLAQHPVTIVLVEQTELAFETSVAKQVLVE